jgi:uncharacterized protein DUF87
MSAAVDRRTPLRLSSDLSLPLEAVTETFGILGKRGSGKTNTSVVLTEQMIQARLPVVVVDPVGVWWGLRHAKDGKSPGLPVILLGGEHGDLPLEEKDGTLIADFLIECRSPVVLDLGSFSKGAQRRFMVDFAERLYHANRQALHVVLDEADTFIPQRIERGSERLVGAINDLVRKGRARGLGVTLISQRPALINKDVLTQIEVLIAMRMTGPQDRDAIERWIEHHADGKRADEVLGSLAELELGQAWVWSPGWLGLFKRVQVDERSTFDSSATPKAGAVLATPRSAASVDLAALRTKLAATIEQAKAEDPRELRKRIAALELELGRAQRSFVNEKQLALIRENARRLTDAFASIRVDSDELLRALASFFERAASPAKVALPTTKMAVEPPRLLRVDSPPDQKLGRCERELLKVLVQRAPRTTSRPQLAILSGYSSSSSSFANALGTLRSSGFAQNTGADAIVATDDGIRWAGPVPAIPRDQAGRVAHWKSRLGKCEASVLGVLVEVYPDALSRERLAEKAGYSPTSSSFANALGRLRTLELLERMQRGLGEGVRASPSLMEDA